MGFRFFPRYYFLLLPAMTMLAARGWTKAEDLWTGKIVRLVLFALLAVPLIRFGPRYITVARGAAWSDLDMDRDSRLAAAKLRTTARPDDTLFVWGFRPDIFIDSGLPAGTLTDFSCGPMTSCQATTV